MSRDEARHDRYVMIGGLLQIIGALVAAIGSGIAGFVSKAGVRKWAAIIGACAAVISATSKVLPEPGRIEVIKNNASRHRLAATKVRTQMPLIEDPRYLKQLRGYVSAQLTECAVADLPADDVQPIPEAPPLPEKDKPATLFVPEKVYGMDGKAPAGAKRAPSPPEINHPSKNDNTINFEVVGVEHDGGPVELLKHRDGGAGDFEDLELPR